MHYRADYVTRLAAMGAPITPDTVVSSARATALHLAHHEPGVRRVLVLGANGLERELRDVGLEVVTAGPRGDPDAPGGHRRLVRGRRAGCGRDRARPEPDLPAPGRRGRLRPRRRAVDRHQPRPDLPDGARPATRAPGSIAAALEATTGVIPYVIGKPSPHLLELAAEAVGRPVGEAVMIGDGIHSDLAAARAVGARCVFMLTGVTTAGAAGRPAAPTSSRPPWPRTPPSWRRSSRPSSRGLARRQASGRELRDPRRPRVERGAQRREGRLVGEGDVERVAVDRPQLGQGQPDRLDRADVLLGQA